MCVLYHCDANMDTQYCFIYAGVSQLRMWFPGLDINILPSYSYTDTY